MIVILGMTATVTPTAIPIFRPSIVASLLWCELYTEIVDIRIVGTEADRVCSMVVDSGDVERFGIYEFNHANGVMVIVLEKLMRIGNGL